MSPLADIRARARFVLGLPRFLRHPISIEDSRAIVRRRLAERQTNFLRLVERGIFGNQKSPYRWMLELAGCEQGDIRSMVRTSRLEGTLRSLRSAGVYVTFDEFKCREPIVRNGHVLAVTPHDFDNPYLSHYYHAESGGSSGPRTRVLVDLDHLAAQAPYAMLNAEAQGVLDVPTAFWRPIRPASSGINNVLRSARFGLVPKAWFAPVVGRHMTPDLRHRISTLGTVLVGRLSGVAIPKPKPVRLDEAIVVARWAVEAIQAHGACRRSSSFTLSDNSVGAGAATRSTFTNLALVP